MTAPKSISLNSPNTPPPPGMIDGDGSTLPTPAPVEPASDGEAPLNDAIVFGKATDRMLELIEEPVTFLRGQFWKQHDKRNTQDGGWKTINMTWGQWIEGGPGDANNRAWGLSRHPVGKRKEGDGIVLGDSLDGARKAKAMTSMYALGLDIDSGASLDDVIDTLESLGLMALIYTTHSHGKSGLELKRDDVLRKLDLDGPLTDADIFDYLRHHSKARFEESFIAAVKIIEEKKQTKDGTKVIVGTPPLDKFRVILPLDQPVRITDLADRHDDALRVFEDKITGLATKMLGVHFDTSCTDPSRLFYTARHSKGAEWDCVFMQGAPIKFEDVPPASKAEYARSREIGADNAFTVAGTDTADKFGTPRVVLDSGLVLNDWHTLAMHRFQIADLIDAKAPDKVRVAGGEAHGQIHIECPFEHLHSEEGGTAAMAMNPEANEKELWTVFCHHHSCQSRHKSEFLKEMIDQKWFEENDLTDLDNYSRPSDDELGDDETDPIELFFGGVEIAQRLDAETKAAPDEGDDDGDEEEVIEDDGPNWGPHTRSQDVKAHFQKLIAAAADLAILELEKDKIAKASPLGKRAIQKIISEVLAAKKRADKEKARRASKGRSCCDDEPFDVQCRYVAHAFEDRRDKPTVFHAGDGLVRIECEDGIAKSALVDHNALRNEIGRVAPFDRDGKNIAVPKDVRDWLWGEPNADHFPPLVSVQTTPFFAANGRLVREPGYHPDAQVWLDLPEGMRDLDVPNTPTEDDVNEGLLLLTQEVFGDFPVGGADRDDLLAAYHGDEVNPSWANLIGLTILPFARQMIDGPTPGHLLEKPQPRTGATLLADTVTTIATGFPAPALAMPGNKEEVSKTLTTVLKEGQNIVFFDNINHEVDSGELASAMTARRYTARVLGSTKSVTVPVQCLWISTGNNVGLSGELAERHTLVELNAHMPQPGQRSEFRHADILTWVRDNRPAVVRACLILIQNWIAKGKPAGTGRLGGFEAWVRVIGGILAAAEVEGFMENRDQLVRQTSTKEDPVQMLMDRLCNFNNGQIIRAGTDKAPQGVRLADGQSVVKLLDILNTPHEITGERIFLDKWGMVDGDYCNPASAGAGFRQLVRQTFHCTDDEGGRWAVTLSEEKDTAGHAYYVMSKVTLPG